MNIQFQNIDEVSAELIVKIEPADYQDKVEKSLKTLRQKANIPGFRPGMVPMGLIKKQYGRAAKAEEINKILQEKVYAYLTENKIDMLGEPLPNEEKQQELDFDENGDFEFTFSIALAPKFDATLTTADKVPYYEIEPTDDMVESQVKMYTQRTGEFKKVDSYQENDMLKGTLVQLDAQGNPEADGIQVTDAVIMPSYMKGEGKEVFNDIKVNDVVTFNPNKVYEGNQAEIASLLKKKKEEVEGLTSDFSFQVQEISRFENGELNQEIFDQVFEKGTVTTPEEFRAKIKENIVAGMAVESDYKFLQDVRTYLSGRIGKLQFPDELLKKIMKMNNPEKEESFVDDNYEKSIEELTWHLMKEQLTTKFGIKIEQADVTATAREATRAQFAQYGMMNVPDALLDNYAQEMLKKKESQEGLVNRTIEKKLTEVIKGTVTLKKKKVSAEEFNKMNEEAK